MSPTVTPAAAFARVTATGTFTQDGFTYEPGPSEPYGPEDTVHATHDASGAQFCASGLPGTPHTAEEAWVLL